MSLKALIFVCFLTLFCTVGFSQDYFLYGGGNFSGLNQVIANPANAADNRLKLDVIAGGLDFNFNNSWFAVKREALQYKNHSFPKTWKNATPNTRNNVYKNFEIINTGKTRAGIIEARILLPSFLFQVDTKNSFAFTWSIRQISNADGLSQQFATLFEKELDLSVTQNNRVQNKNLSAVQMSWAEYGLTYARVLKDNNEHFIKAGITPKLLEGLEATYLVINNMDFLLSTKDTLSFFNANISYAHSANLNSPLNNGKLSTDFYHYTSKPGLGLDLGFVYEWRPNYRTYQYNEAGTTYWKKDQNKYKIKFGASIVDLGKITFVKDGKFYDLDVAIKNNTFKQFTTVKDLNEFDSLLRADFSNKNITKEFSVLLPTALNTQLDFSVNHFFYLNLSSHLSNLIKSNLYQVHNYSAICFAPRIEHYWFDLSIPFTYNTLSAERNQYIMTGLNLRLGPLSFGSCDLIPLFKGNVSAFNFYAILKVSIPHKKFRDKDADGVRDEKDECPDDKGDVALAGCPDIDHDNIPDYLDGCPHQPGIARFRGCLDTDNDSIPDAEDQCPFEKGGIALNGCPDTDGDGIIDKRDSCKTKAGLPEFNGCPDADNDGVHDDIDHCPTIAGAAENSGCPWPDTDKDGVIDRLDSCINTPGIAALNGCPKPVILAPTEKTVLQKAYAKLEFESGKGVIKPSSFPTLNALAKLLLLHQSDWKITLRGYTDNEGTEANNLILSEKRAKAVEKYLVRKSIPKENISVQWFGQGKQIADNSTKEGKQKNRRVEMVVTFK